MVINVISVNENEGQKRQKDLVHHLEGSGLKIKFYIGKRTVNGYDSAFKSIKMLIQDNLDKDHLLFGEDDLILTKTFSMERLEHYIELGYKKGYDIIATGSWEGYGYELNDPDLLDVLRFRGTQLLVIYKNAYKRILEAEECNYFDDFLSFVRPRLKVGLTYPFLSKQRTDIPSMLVAGGSNFNHLFDVEENRIKELIKNQTEKYLSNN
ncbi:hypothetical protein [Pedobacter montanisoli]|uniref:Uncharacterized protein n=1 Tax=Pedobacter montanisoli TaxID=2923277 RepID=A0ABS9ZXU6_9SPHI|nr:hypothetical protein [Pedobacter montanisoli]MCJ0743119.1 hypothetical protein [Pedobacter montanisoli]